MADSENPEMFTPSLGAETPAQAARTYDDHTHAYLAVVISILGFILWRVW